MRPTLRDTLNSPYPDDPGTLDLPTWSRVRAAMREAATEIERMHIALGDILEMDDLEAAKSRALIALPQDPAQQLEQVFNDLLAGQEPLGPEFERVIEENLESLYETK